NQFATQQDHIFSGRVRTGTGFRNGYELIWSGTLYENDEVLCSTVYSFSYLVVTDTVMPVSSYQADSINPDSINSIKAVC
ncbi:MAG: hypothetical protein ABRQ38_17485, partial [Candidatus Eremiobacterota bacterium]